MLLDAAQTDYPTIDILRVSPVRLFAKPALSCSLTGVDGWLEDDVGHPNTLPILDRLPTSTDDRLRRSIPLPSLYTSLRDALTPLESLTTLPAPHRRTRLAWTGIPWDTWILCSNLV